VSDPLAGPAQADESASLVLETERSDKTPRTRCLRAFVVGGVVIPCQRRDCLSCGPRRARETARILLLDAQDEPPTHSITLTTRDPETTAEMYRTGSEAVFRRLRRRYGRVEYFGRIEFTTGRGPLSGGARRIHGHYVVKGLAGVACAEAGDVVRESWRRSLARNGSSFEAWRIEVAELRTPAGALHYLSLHHAKAGQLPPEGWRGMAERPSRGYFARPMAELREEARAQLWAESLAYTTGLDPDDARLLVDQERESRAAWRQEYENWRKERRWEPVASPLVAESREAEPPTLFGGDDIPF
jgi:hypothetical protein